MYIVKGKIMKICPKCASEHEEIDKVCICGYSFEENVIKKVTKWARFFHYHKLNAKYSALYVIGLILDVLAIVSLAGIFLGVIGGLYNHSFMMIVFSVISGMLSFIVFKGFSEIIILFIGMEENTSHTNKLLEKILESIKVNQLK